jgi:NCS1 family nucleobase:cation symporter-1
MHLAQRGTLYAFPAGVNWAGLVALLLGAAFYLWLYNPITLETHAAFSAITASLPAAAVAALTYLLLTRLLYSKRTPRKAE